MNKNIILAGVGGQGILFATKILAETACQTGKKILVSETHGMSQRGGSVVSHLKIGQCSTPLVRRGTAHLVYIFARGELFQNLSFLARGSTCIVNDKDNQSLPGELQEVLGRWKINLLFFDGQTIGENLGTVLCANMALVGFSLARDLLPFSKEEVEKTIQRAGKAKFCEINLKALSLGFRAGQL